MLLGFSLFTVPFEPEDIGLSQLLYDVIAGIVHVVVFFWLGYSLSSVSRQILSRHLNPFYVYFVLLLLGIMFAGGSEYLQIRTSRDASVLDIVWDIFGFILGLSSNYMFSKFRNTFSRKREIVGEENCMTWRVKN